jgi:integrase/recombinase XerD
VFINWCIDHDYYDGANPCRKVRTPRVPQSTRPRALSHEQVQKLLAEAKLGWNWLGMRDHAMLMLMFDTGCRQGGLLSMTDSSIDWTRKRLILHEKGGKNRHVPIGQPTIDAVKQYLHHRPRPCETCRGWLIREERGWKHRRSQGGHPAKPGPYSGPFWLTWRYKQMGSSSLDSMVAKLGDYAGIENVHPHRFRHTFAVMFYEQTRDIMGLMVRLGHTRVEVTQRYLRDLGVDYGIEEYGSPTSWSS